MRARFINKTKFQRRAVKMSAMIAVKHAYSSGVETGIGHSRATMWGRAIDENNERHKEIASPLLGDVKTRSRMDE